MEQVKAKRNFITLLLSPLIVVACLFVIYYLRGIYPFGTLSVVQGDLEQQYCAMYTQLYDVLKGEASPLFSWLTALGRGQSMDMMIFGCYSPLNLLFLLVPRDTLLVNMSFFVLMKLSLSAFAMAWYVRKRFPSLPGIWQVFFGVAYGLSGHALLHFHNTLWLEAMILLPVYLFYAERMLLTRRLLPYTLLLTSLLLLNLYTAAMVCVFTFFAGGAYIVLLLPREERGRAALRIAAGTLIAFALSAFLTVPVGIQLFRAARLGYSATGLFTPFTEYSALRGFALATAVFALLLLPWRLYTRWKTGERKQATFMAVTLLCMLLPLFFEGIDKLWHFGGNIGFAHRYGFITVFLVLAFSAEALSAYQKMPERLAGKKLKRILQIAVMAAVLLLYAYVMLRDGRRSTDFIEWNRPLLTVLTLVTAAAYLAAWLLSGKRMMRALFLAILLLQVFCYGYSAFLADDTLDLTQATSAEATALSAAFPETDDISRVKLEDASLTINYPKYLGRPALSSFSSSTTQSTLDTAKAMGYGVSAYAIQDCGGTLFSDALLHVCATVSRSDRFTEDAAYAFRARVGSLNVYDNVYSLPFGLVGSAALSAIRIDDYRDCFALQNALYATFSGKAEPIITEADAVFTDVPEEALADCKALIPMDAYGGATTAFAYTTIDVNSTQRVYLYNRGVPGAKLSAFVKQNGALVRVTELHPITYLDGIYDLGAYTDASITVTVAGDAQTANADVCVALLDTDALAAFTAKQNAAPDVTEVRTGKRSLTLSVTAYSDTDILFLPMQYSANWRAKLDGNTVTPCRIAGDYLGFALSSGMHTLTMSYWPAGQTAGIVCSILALAAVCWLFAWERKGRILFHSIPSGIDKAAEKLLLALWLGALLGCYVLPAAYAMAFWYKDLH